MGKEIDARRLWELGESVNPSEYKILMAWVYLKWISTMAPRRLEYSNTQMVTKQEYEETKRETIGSVNGIGIFIGTKLLSDTDHKSCPSPGL